MEVILKEMTTIEQSMFLTKLFEHFLLPVTTVEESERRVELINSILMRL